jgi:hypothetical protein
MRVPLWRESGRRRRRRGEPHRTAPPRRFLSFSQEAGETEGRRSFPEEEEEEAPASRRTKWVGGLRLLAQHHPRPSGAAAFGRLSWALKAHRSSSSSPHLILPNLLHTDGPLPSLATRSWEPLCLSCNVKFFLMVNIYYYYE